MKKQRMPHRIAVTLTAGVHLELRELTFLRYMAQHCIQTNMSGSNACVTLDDALRDMGIPDYDGRPVQGIFE